MVWAKFWIMISFDGIYIYSSELFPTVIRSVNDCRVFIVLAGKRDLLQFKCIKYYFKVDDLFSFAVLLQQ